MNIFIVSKRLLSWKRHENTSQVTQQPGQIEITSHLPPASILNAEWPAESWELPAEPLNIFLFWTTSRKSFRNRNYQVIDAYFYHHPDAKLHIIASNLTQTDFLQYIQLGYHIQVHSLNDQYLFQLSEGCPMAKPWLDRVHEWRRGQYFYSHITDFMRFCLLYQYGGMYSDFDAIALQPMDKQLRSFIGKDKSNSGGMCEWCLVGGENYLAPGVMAVETKHHPLLEAVLSRGFNPDSYDSKIFGAVGPQAITKAYNSLQNPLIEVLENHILYPYTFVDSAELMRNRNDSWGLVERMKRTSLSLHFFGHTTRGLAVEPMSILAAAFNHTSLIVRNSTTPSDSADCGLLLKVPAYIPAGKGYGRVNDVRILVRSDFPAKCDASELRFWVNLRSRNGELKMPLVSRDKSAKLFAVGADQQHTIAELNYQLSRIFYQMPFQAERDEITVELVVQQNQAAHSSRSVVSSHVISVYNPSKLVTIMIKTFGRMEKVFSLVHSIKKRYPYISIIASDDSERAYRVKSGKLRFFDYLALPYDTGLSGGRNQMLQLIKTEYFLTLDDDFQFDENSVIEGLLHGLEHGGFDIVAGKNPRDEHRFKLDFCGLFRIDTDTLYLEPGEYGVHAGCNHVDFVPNLFVARTSLRDRIKWDDQLKLGEHEDFFLRAKSLGLRVGTCAAVAFHHDQVEHWLKKTNYDKMRSRVYDFWRISLRKHKLKKIRSFGTLMMDLTRKW
jgi:hypothetical protein